MTVVWIGWVATVPRAFVWFMLAAFFIWLAVHFLGGGIV